MVKYKSRVALVAQRIRALVFGTRGRRFESYRGCHRKKAPPKRSYFSPNPTVFLKLTINFLNLGVLENHVRLAVEVTTNREELCELTNLLD